jgi:hypothetical protein
MRNLILATSSIGRLPTKTTFFGEVAADQFINGNALAVAMGITAGISQNSTAGWLKFFDVTDGKIKYIAKRSYRHSISRDQLNAVGVITGSRQVVIGGKSYKVRLLSGSFSDPSQNNVGIDAPASHGSEWNRLMYHICNGVAADSFTSEGGNLNWAEYSDADLGVGATPSQGSFTICKEVHGANPNYAVCRGYGGAPGTVTYLGYTTFSDASSRMGWRPLLELVN